MSPLAKRKLLSCLLALALICLTALPAFAHPGRTDSSGGHNDNIHGGYHWHDANGNAISSPPSSGSSSGSPSGSGSSSSLKSTASSPILIYATSLTLTKATAKKIYVGDTFELACKYPPNVTDISLSWTISDESIVEQIAAERFKALAAGKVTVRVEDAYSKKTASIELEIFTVVVESVALELSQEVFLPGDKADCAVTILPYNASDKTYTLTSSDSEIIKITGNAIECLKPGEAVITAQAADGCTAEIAVTVTSIKVESVVLKLANTTFNPGDSTEFTVTILPVDATDQSYDVFSSNSEVVQVDGGSIQCLAEGEAVITVVADGQRAEVSVTVKKVNVAAILAITCGSLALVGGIVALSIVGAKKVRIKREEKLQALIQRILAETDKKKRKELLRQIPEMQRRKEVAQQLKEKDEAEKKMVANGKKTERQERMRKIIGLRPKTK